MNNLLIGDFIEGSAVVIKKENMFLVKGLMFEDGKIKLFNALYFSDFHCDLAAIDLPPLGYINRRGEYQIPHNYLTGEIFVDNIALVSSVENVKLINTNNEVIKIFNENYVTNPFHQGYALLHEISEDGEYMRDVFINNRGEFILSLGAEKRIHSPFDLNNPNDYYSDGRIRYIYNDLYGFKDLEDEIVVPASYDNAYRFSEGLAMVENDGKCGFINTQGEEEIPLEFESAKSFSEGIAAVKFDNRWGCIDKDCNQIIPFVFDALGSFSNGEIEFMIDNKWGLMNKNMDIIVEPKYDSITHFHEGIAKFSLNGKAGFIDGKGNELMSDLLIGCEYYHKLNKYY